jgi:hypothetical protein
VVDMIDNDESFKDYSYNDEAFILDTVPINDYSDMTSSLQLNSHISNSHISSQPNIVTSDNDLQKRKNHLMTMLEEISRCSSSLHSEQPDN